jgi:hypothetical protein
MLPQSGNDPEPKVAAFRGYPGKGIAKDKEPQGGLCRFAGVGLDHGHNPFGVRNTPSL